jgi:transaldolase
MAGLEAASDASIAQLASVASFFVSRVDAEVDKRLDDLGTHGTVTGDTITGTYDEARTTFSELEELGISYDDAVRVLEVEGVDKFTDSGDEVLATLTKQLENVAPG